MLEHLSNFQSHNMKNSDILKLILSTKDFITFKVVRALFKKVMESHIRSYLAFFARKYIYKK